MIVVKASITSLILLLEGIFLAREKAHICEVYKHVLFFLSEIFFFFLFHYTLLHIQLELNSYGLKHLHLNWWMIKYGLENFVWVFVVLFVHLFFVLTFFQSASAPLHVSVSIQNSWSSREPFIFYRVATISKF